MRQTPLIPLYPCGIMCELLRSLRLDVCPSRDFVSFRPPFLQMCFLLIFSFLSMSPDVCTNPLVLALTSLDILFADQNTFFLFITHTPQYKHMVSVTRQDPFQKCYNILIVILGFLLPQNANGLVTIKYFSTIMYQLENLCVCVVFRMFELESFGFTNGLKHMSAMLYQICKQYTMFSVGNYNIKTLINPENVNDGTHSAASHTLTRYSSFSENKHTHLTSIQIWFPLQLMVNYMYSKLF